MTLYNEEDVVETRRKIARLEKQHHLTQQDASLAPTAREMVLRSLARTIAGMRGDIHRFQAAANPTSVVRAGK